MIITIKISVISVKVYFGILENLA